MITLQHSLITLFAQKADIEKFEKEIPYVLFPDAVRRYAGPRQYTHFEKTENGDNVSWIKFPKNIKNINESTLEMTPKYLAPEIRPCVIGEETDIDKFEKTNKHLNLDYFFGVKKHLKQDWIFDKFIREKIDTSKRYEDEFKFNDETLDGKQLRSLIADIENQGVYILAYMLHKAYGITANQEWFDEHVKKKLDAAYPEELSESTYKYMKIPENINEMITNHDWSKLNDGILSIEDYKQMYKEVASSMIEIDFEKEEARKKEDAEFGEQ